MRKGELTRHRNKIHLNISEEEQPIVEPEDEIIHNKQIITKLRLINQEEVTKVKAYFPCNLCKNLCNNRDHIKVGKG